MFWGLIMEPQRRYAQKVNKSFHISMAAIDVSTSSNEPAQVMCGFEGRNYLLCTLKKPDVLQCPLNLNFDVGSDVSFMANGRCHIHLTGYLNDDFADLEDEEGEAEEEEEAPRKSNKRAQKVIESAPPSKKHKNGVTSSQAQDEEDSDSDDGNYLKDLLGKSLEEDEDDSDASIEEDGEEAEEEGDEEEEEDENEDLEEEEESSLSEEEEEEEEETKPKVNGLPSSKTNQVELQQKKKAKKNKEKQVAEVKKVQPKNEQKKEGKTPNKENQTPKKKTLQGGIIIEEIKEGQGAFAKNGKFVNVYYEGRLKQNNKMFDSTTKGAGFSFRLGSGEVIKGWDVGVAGMKAGGKRRITCPPSMAYGQKGSPPAIPPNSTLVFEVELRKVN